ncbi:hypothetical protein [uncultured Draconibacterium sp.]|uniref:hypothetical protein n=1 Tax=uncultured Draconibacterium sp. TaxID=1573823 RepID=UPI0025E34092|nr:hypothetical protein [uncultured Draconibacterium sp.]
MELHYKGRYLKLIPRKFFEIENITDYLEDEFDKRLTDTERENLSAALFQQRVERSFLSGLKEREPLVAEQIEGAKPIITYRVITNDGQRYYVLKLDNGRSVRCSEAVYRISPNKGRIRYANGLNSGKIPPPVPSSSKSIFNN